MFTTFDVATSNSVSGQRSSSSPTSQPRPKRAQVSRACDWCRLTRVKCDSTRPCRNCKQAKRECVNSGRDDFKSVAAATKLVREQQDALLDLYWQGYHVIYPVLEESEFRKHYNSLWQSDTIRHSCPLADIVVALCIQFGSSYTASENVVMPDQPGYEFYLRSQRALGHVSEAPTLRSVQCYFLSAIYLLTFNQTNSAYMMVRSAVAAAESIGLQLDDDDDDDDDSLDDTGSANTGPRLWGCLITLDTQLALHLGRPFAVPSSQIYNPTDPESDEMAQLVGPGFGGPFDINWLRFQHERHTLFQIVREIHTELMAVIENVLEEIGYSDIYQHPSSREKCAKYLYEQFKRLKSWVEELPEDLKAPRVQGVPFSVDRSTLNLSQTEPLWLQRQRLILELDYHSMVIMLTRTFNSFLPTPALGTFNSDNHCITCVNSGIMMTIMLHQVIRDSEILTGWFQVVGWQQIATFSLAGFACGYPICPLSPTARRTLIRAARVFEIVNSQESVKLTYNLQSKCLEIVQSFCARLGIVTPATTPTDSQKDSEDLDDSLGPGAYKVMSIGEQAFSSMDLLNMPHNEVWSADTPAGFLWGDLMRDLDSSLVSSLQNVGVDD
ncbi:hypothetical protein KAF25_010881 [Fusarium avenaceum]|uniref:Zn(2)-C6 fungal-type domain-containing protein n=1 Tax=Fusarium avenaceum TaxID=40199 RepID=A0A9P7H0A6_9HYPO|nr:hypothetical protein KAF25_010881 [Fusarium avenaceum]